MRPVHRRHQRLQHMTSHPLAQPLRADLQRSNAPGGSFRQRSQLPTSLKRLRRGAPPRLVLQAPAAGTALPVRLAALKSTAARCHPAAPPCLTFCPATPVAPCIAPPRPALSCPCARSSGSRRSRRSASAPPGAGGWCPAAPSPPAAAPRRRPAPGRRGGAAARPPPWAPLMACRQGRGGGRAGRGSMLGCKGGAGEGAAGEGVLAEAAEADARNLCNSSSPALHAPRLAARPLRAGTHRYVGAAAPMGSPAAPAAVPPGRGAASAGLSPTPPGAAGEGA